MSPGQIGRVVRTLRRRQEFRQADLAGRSGVSRATISRLERDGAAGLTVERLVAIFAALDGRVDLRLTWHGAALDRLLDESHARLSGQVLAIAARHGWEPQMEVTFSRFGERGSIDVLAWHPPSRILLVVEIKSELGSMDGLLRPLDVKVRLAPVVARERFGWHPGTVAKVVVLPEHRTARRMAERHCNILAVALPDRSHAVRRWLRASMGPLSGLWFLSDVTDASVPRNPSSIRRVRGRLEPRPAHRSRSGSGA